MTPTDHAELARTVEAMRRAEHDAENAPTRLEKSNASRALKDMQRFMGSTVPALLAEIAALRGDLGEWKGEWEAACSARINDRSRSQEIINERDKWIAELIREQESAGNRATQTERQRDEAVQHVENLVDRLHSIRDSSIVLIAARTFLASLTADHVSDARQMVQPTDFFAENAKNPQEGPA